MYDRFFWFQAGKLEKLRERMVQVRELFRDTDSTEFVIVTIPTVKRHIYLQAVMSNKGSSLTFLFSEAFCCLFSLTDFLSTYKLLCA